MASYLQGSNDYIPDIQPFRPDLNFYQGALEKKEGQYQQGLNKLSGIYGTLLNAPLIRDDNTQNRDKMFKDIHENIQKIAGMDLSLEENVNSAYKVFQPLLDDKNLQYDMMFTKKYHNELQTAEGFRNCIDPKKCGGGYSDVAVQALHYRADDFKNASRESSMGMPMPKFTPMVDTTADALQLAKDLGIGTTSSYVKDGYIHTTSNGNQLILPLTDFLLAHSTQNSKALDYARTQAYVDRKNFIKSNAQQYGSEDAAENVYLNTFSKELDRRANQSNASLDGHTQSLTAKNAILKSKLENNTSVDPKGATGAVQDYQDQLDRIAAVRDHNQSTLNYLDKNAMLGANKDVIRNRIEGALANEYLRRDAYKAAADYSMMTHKDSMIGDPFALQSMAHQYKLDEMEKEFGYNQKLEMIKLAAKNKIVDHSNNGPISANVYQNLGIRVGTTTVNPVSELNSVESALGESKDGYKQAATGYLSQIFDFYRGRNTSTHTPAEQTDAKNNLISIFGKYYDPIKNTLKPHLDSDPNDYIQILAKAQGLIHGSQKDLFSPELLNELSQKENDINLKGELWKGYTKLMTGNNLAIKHYAEYEGKGLLTNEEKAGLQLYVKGNSDIRRRGEHDGELMGDYEWKSTFKKYNPHYTDKQVDEAFNKTKAKYNELYNHPDGLSNDPNYQIKVWNGSYALSKQTGGRMGSNIVQLSHDASWNTSESNNSLISLGDNLDKEENNPNIHYVIGGANILKNDVKSNEGVYGEISRKIFKDYINDCRRLLKDENDKNDKKVDKNAPAANVRFSAVAAGDDNYTMYTIIPNHDWLRKHFTGKTNMDAIPNKEIYDKIIKEGISTLIPVKNPDGRQVVDNRFYTNSKIGPYEQLIRLKQTTDFDFGKNGTLHVVRNPDGTTSITGSLYKYENGQYKKQQEIDTPNIAGASLDDIMKSATTDISRLQQSNDRQMAYEAQVTNNKSK